MSESDETQYKAWGGVVRNRNLGGVHIANGLVQLLRVTPLLVELGQQLGQAAPAESVKLVTSTLSERWDVWNLKKNLHTLGLCVTKSKNYGELNLRGRGGNYTEIIHAINEHLSDVLKEPLKDHRLIAHVLNADEKVYLTGGADLSVSSLRLAGYTSTHTLAPMHAFTFLAALCSTPHGLDSLMTIYRLFQDESDPHSTLTRYLELGLSSTPALNEAKLRDVPPFLLPEDSDQWRAFGERASVMTSRLLRWAEGGAKADLLSALVELIALLSVSNLWRWTGVEVLLLSPPEVRRRDASLISIAQRSFATAGNRLDEHAKEHGLLSPPTQPTKQRRLLPSDSMKTLARVTGWLSPLSAQGGARHHLGPGSRTLTTLTRALIYPGEELSWERFRARAKELSIELGGVESASGTISSSTLYELSCLNQETLITLGLARQESDDVLRVDAGGARWYR